MVASRPGVIRYIAPELFDSGDFGSNAINPSEKSDIYSFAITAFEVIAFKPRGSCYSQTSVSRYQILSEELPYGSGRETRIVYNITTGERLRRPNNAAADRWLPDPIWDALQHCWGLNPDSRPSVKSLHRVFTEQEEKTPVAENNKGEHNVL